MSVSAPTPGLFFQLADLGLPTSQSQFMALWLSQMTTQYPGYSPSPADPEYVQAQVFASWAASVAQLCSAGATELFRQFGVQMLGLPYEQGSPALAIVTVTAMDTAGYTLPASTQLTLTLGGAQVAFATAQPLTIPVGQSTGQVLVAAVSSGAAFNGAGTPAALVAQVNWVTTVDVLAAASGGVDQEDDDAYMQRLALTLQTLGLATATASALATRAVDFTPASGTDQQQVGRATAIDGYSPVGESFTVTTTGSSASLNVTTAPGTGIVAAPGASISGTNIPAGATVVSATSTTIVMSAAATSSGSNVIATVAGTLGNERTVTVCVTDALGNTLDADTLTAVQAYLETFREVNFVINVISPTASLVYAAVTVAASPGYLATTVQDNVQAALLAYLSPVTFALPQGALQGWQDTQTVYLSRVAAVIQGTAGVDHIVAGSLALGLTASPTATSDLVLPGAFPAVTSTTASIPLSEITVH